MPDTFITEALDLHETRNIRRLLVVKARRLLGIMTEYWLFKVIKG